MNSLPNLTGSVKGPSYTAPAFRTMVSPGRAWLSARCRSSFVSSWITEPFLVPAVLFVYQMKATPAAAINTTNSPSESADDLRMIVIRERKLLRVQKHNYSWPHRGSFVHDETRIPGRRYTRVDLGPSR